MRPWLSWIERHPPKVEVTRSNRVGRATSVQNWARQNLSFLRFQQRPTCAEARFSIHDAQLFLVDFDALSEHGEVIAPVAAAIGSHAFAGCPGNRLESFWCDRPPGPLNRVLSPLCPRRAWSHVAFSSPMRSFSMGSERSATPFSMASCSRLSLVSASAALT